MIIVGNTIDLVCHDRKKVYGFSDINYKDKKYRENLYERMWLNTNIKINNYENLQNLNLNICENKINYIFFISCSEKSSIGNAFKKEKKKNKVVSSV